MRPKTHYEILGVAHDIPHGDLAVAYREALTRAYEKTPPDPDRLAAIREAHRVLTDGAERLTYNATLPPSTPPLGRRATALPSAISASADAGMAQWTKWLMVAIFALACLIWWRSKKPPTGVPVVTTSQASPVVETVVEVVNAPAIDSESSQKPAREVFAMASSSVGRMRVFDGNGRHIGSGSAVVIGRETIITNCHVVAPGVSAGIDIGGRTFGTQLVVADQELDLCKMHVPGLHTFPVSISSVANVYNGQTVYAIGAPGGGAVVISEGVVTTLHAIRAGNVIQTTAPVSPGSSGGGLFSATGKLIGIVTFQQRGLEQRNYAIPIDWLERMETREGSGQSDQVVPPVYPNS